MARQINTAAGRFYELPNGARVPSVTHVLQIVNKPAIAAWAAKLERAACVEAAADLYLDVLKLPKGLGRASFVASLESRIGAVKASDKEMAKAAEIGTLAHKRVEWEIRRELGIAIGPEPALSDAALWAFMAWQDWYRAAGLRPLFAEQTVFSIESEYAGTIDLLAECLRPLAIDGQRFATGDRLVLDWKTSKALHAEADLQNVAYQAALEEMGHGPIAGGVLVRLPKVDSDPAFEVRAVPARADLMPAFLALRRAWDWWHGVEVAYQARRKGARGGANG
jgi:hypothetical protein